MAGQPGCIQPAIGVCSLTSHAAAAQVARFVSAVQRPPPLSRDFPPRPVHGHSKIKHSRTTINLIRPRCLASGFEVCDVHALQRLNSPTNVGPQRETRTPRMNIVEASSMRLGFSWC